MALESLLIEEQQIYAELANKAKQGNHLRKIINESVTEEGLMELAESSLYDGYTNNTRGTNTTRGSNDSRGTAYSRGNMNNIGEHNNGVMEDDNSRGGYTFGSHTSGGSTFGGSTLGGNTIGGNTVGSNGESGVFGVFSQQRELLKSRQRYAADLTEGSGVIHSPSASASTLNPYLLYGKCQNTLWRYNLAI